MIALSLGAEPPSERLVRKWVDEGLLPASMRRGRGKAKGVEWIDAPETLEIGTELIRMRQRGISRVSELRIQLFFMGKNSDFQMVRGALIGERERVLKKLYRYKTLPKDYERADPAKSPTLSAERIRLGPLAEVFKLAGLELSDLEMVELASLAFHEFEASKKNSILPENALARIPGLNLKGHQLPSLAGLLRPQDNKDETRVVELISNASDADLSAALRLFDLLKLFFSNFEHFSGLIGVKATPELKKAFHAGYLALESTPFAVTIFPLCIEYAKWQRSQKPEFSGLMSQVMSLAKSMSGLADAGTGVTKPAN